MNRNKSTLQNILIQCIQNNDPFMSCQQIIELKKCWNKNRDYLKLEFNLNFEQKQFQSYNYPPSIQIKDSKFINTFIVENKIAPNVVLLHSLCHIEFNAMKGYLDTLARFCYQINSNKQEDFIHQCFNIASEESEHFEMLNLRLKKLGFFYGALPAHGGLLEIVKNSEQNLLHRLAMISIIQEGKGLDAGEKLVHKFISMKDNESKNILQIILNQEVNHVKFGRFWFEQICENNKLDYIEEFKKIINENPLLIKNQTKYNIKDRIKAGFNDKWIKQCFS